MSRIHQNHARRDARGFTIVEMVVAISLAAVATAVIFTIFVSTQSMYYDTRTMMETQSDSRIVFGLMSQEIRSAGSDVRNVGVQRLVYAADDTLRIQSDINGDGVLNSVDEPAEDVTYLYDGVEETLVRRTGSGDMLLMSDVVGMQLRYMAANGTNLGPLPLDTAQRARVRAIGITVDFRMDDNAVRRWDTTVAIRNERILP